MGMRSTPLPEYIGRFRVEALLGRGGMGEVYKAFDPTLQRTVAVKTVRPDIDRPEYLDRLMREAQACARLSHPNIVTVYEAGQIDGTVYIAMEYLQGQNLAQVLERKSLSFEGKVRILSRVLDALHHAHLLDVVHRDIKPSNIHIQGGSPEAGRADADGSVKLVDFGLARMLTADTLTASGNVLGTPHYASPEQLKGEEIDRRTDIYSTGVMAYEMLSGRRPFEPDNDSISSVILKVIQEAPAPMDTDMSRMLPAIEGIVSRAMAKAPGDRFQSAEEMRSALDSFLESSRARLSAIESRDGLSTVVVPPASTLVDTGGRSSRRGWWIGGAAAAAVVAALLIGWPSSNVESAAASLAAGPAPAAPVDTVAITPGGGADDVSAAASAPANATPDPGATRDAPVASAPRTVATPPVPARDLNAKAMFASTSTAVAPGLRVRMILEGPNGVAADADLAREFHTGERIRFAFESNIDGYLYVAQRGTSGSWTVLFPNPEINGGLNAVKRFQEHEVPQGNWFQFSGEPGLEQLFVFLSREPMRTLPGFDRPVQSFERGSPALIAALSDSIQSRDLVFAKDTASGGKGPQATYVVNKAELGKSVTASFTLTHKP
ncbi:MAG: serine/threonine-protein kinase [Vicinamibacterales bacterium]